MIDVNLDLEDIGFCFNFSQWSADVENDLYEMPHAETQNPIKTPYFLALSKSVNGISQKYEEILFPCLSNSHQKYVMIWGEFLSCYSSWKLYSPLRFLLKYFYVYKYPPQLY